MSATFERCPKSVDTMAKSLMQEFESHKALLSSGAVIDFVFARAEVDEKTGVIKGHALMKNGVRALGISRKIPLKDRALGRGDAEVALDGDWWAEASEAQQRALLDHELHHLTPKIDKRGMVRDDLGHPVIVLRKHDWEFGFFTCIAERHGIDSMEVIEATRMLDKDGQYLFPQFAKALIATRKEK